MEAAVSRQKVSSSWPVDTPKSQKEVGEDKKKQAKKRGQNAENQTYLMSQRDEKILGLFLLDSMGINRGSMYDTFGDKHSLFVEAFRQYGETVRRDMTDLLEETGSPKEKLETVMRDLVPGMLGADPQGSTCRGCLITNTAVELAPHDREVAEVARSLLERTALDFQRCLERAVAAGEVRQSINTAAVSRYLTTVIQGVMVMGKAGMPKTTIRDAIEIALTTLD